MHDTRRHKDLLTLLCDLFLFLVAILVAFALLHISEKVFDGHALIAGQRVLAEHLDVGLTLVSKEMLFVDRVKLVTEHVKVIQVQVRNVEFGLGRSRLQHLLEAQCTGQNFVVQMVFGTLQSRHELFVGDEVVLILVGC